jgi:hypothetical protein
MLQMQGERNLESVVLGGGGGGESCKRIARTLRISLVGKAEHYKCMMWMLQCGFSGSKYCLLVPEVRPKYMKLQA